ncbi:hypothetical protein K7432_010727 [Basidiobolus ranarum]|uniref:Cyclin n=1 Tax=Basidiobolus ranarum TaxID=34480 RepID=A0ABR2WND1_9FUNG
MLDQILTNSTEATLRNYFQNKATKLNSSSDDLSKTIKHTTLPIIRSSTVTLERPRSTLSTCVEDTLTKRNSIDIEAKAKLHIVGIVANIINHMFECGSNGKPTNSPSLEDFIHRIYRRGSLSITNLLTGLLFLIRLKEYHPSCKGTHGSGHRLFLSAIIIANKYLYDGAYHNNSWVKVAEGKYSLLEINQMECELLSLLKYRLVVSKREWIEFSKIIDSKLERSGSRHHFVGPKDYLFEKLISNMDWPLSK